MSFTCLHKSCGITIQLHAPFSNTQLKHRVHLCCMPRLSRHLLAFAFKEHTLLPLLLRSCHDLRSARLELKWLEKHARDVQYSAQHKEGHSSWRSRLLQFCLSRSRGKPLQYILGTEYFGELELRCSSKVLIPRYCNIQPLRRSLLTSQGKKQRLMFNTFLLFYDAMLCIYHRTYESLICVPDLAVYRFYLLTPSR
jgi:hypothetical protein